MRTRARAHASAHARASAGTLVHGDLCRQVKGDARRSWGNTRKQRAAGGVIRQGDRLSAMPSARKKGCYARATGSLPRITRGTQGGTPRREVLWHAACKRHKRATGGGAPNGIASGTTRGGCEWQWVKPTTARRRGRTERLRHSIRRRISDAEQSKVLQPCLRQLGSGLHICVSPRSGRPASHAHALPPHSPRGPGEA